MGSLLEVHIVKKVSGVTEDCHQGEQNESACVRVVANESQSGRQFIEKSVMTAYCPLPRLLSVHAWYADTESKLYTVSVFVKLVLSRGSECIVQKQMGFIILQLYAALDNIFFSNHVIDI